MCMTSLQVVLNKITIRVCEENNHYVINNAFDAALPAAVIYIFCFSLRKGNKYLFPSSAISWNKNK